LRLTRVGDAPQIDAMSHFAVTLRRFDACDLLQNASVGKADLVFTSPNASDSLIVSGDGGDWQVFP
jgi:hypothetical protein